MRHDWTCFTAWASPPIGRRVRVSLAGDDKSRVVLLRAVESVRKLVVDPNTVDFRSRLIHLGGPRAPAVDRNVGAAVVRLDHDLAILRTDPNVMIVAMWGAQRSKRFAGIEGLKETFGASVNNISVRRIGAERRVIERALSQ